MTRASRSCDRLPGPAAPERRPGPLAATELRAARNPLGQRHEDEREADKEQRELRGEPGVLGGVVAPDRYERERGDVGDDADRVQTREKHERHDPEPERGVGVSANVTLDAE